MPIAYKDDGWPRLRNVNSIAEVEGVDALFFGPDDMSVEAGLPMDKPRPDKYFSKAIRSVANAAVSHNKIVGGVFISPESVREAVGLGYRIIVSTADVVLLASRSKEKSKEVRQSLDK